MVSAFYLLTRKRKQQAIFPTLLLSRYLITKKEPTIICTFFILKVGDSFID